MELTDRQYQLLDLLSDGKFKSGEQLAQALGVSRATIFNDVAALQANGVRCHQVKGKGTKLESAIDWLDDKKIIEAMTSAQQQLMPSLTVLTTCPSTNQYINQKNSVTPLKSGSVCLAEQQTAGRGRMGRVWVSPFAQNIYLSLCWRFSGQLSMLSGLSLVCGVAVCDALATLGIEGHGLKWPNDVLHGEKKLGGILVELQGEPQAEYVAIIGIGLNYQMSGDQATSIDQPWVDLSTVSKKPLPDRNHVAACVLGKVLEALKQFEQDGLASFVEQWNAFDQFKGENIRIISGENSLQGKACGIGETGELMIELPSGEMKRIVSGEVSVRRDNA